MKTFVNEFEMEWNCDVNGKRLRSEMIVEKKTVKILQTNLKNLL
jgi:hypothetical protein